MSRAILPIVVVVSALALTGTSLGSVKRVSFTSVVSPNDYARLEVSVAPRARCTIKVVYDTTVSHARGVGPKAGGRILWRWKVGSSTHAGRWPVTVNCGKSGKLQVRLRVTS